MQQQTQEKIAKQLADNQDTPEEEIKPMFYNKVTAWDKQQSGIIKKILMDDYN